MIVLPVNPELALGPETAGLLMTAEEFDAIEEYDEDYRYELINEVLVVTPAPLARGGRGCLWRHDAPHDRASSCHRE